MASSVLAGKALWQNVAELRMAEARRQRYMKLALAALALLVAIALLVALW